MIDIIKYKREWHIKNKKRLNKKSRQYYYDNQERLLEQCKLYQKNNPEKVNEKNREWKKNNPEKVKKQGKIYRQMNMEKELERQRIYRKNNKEKVKSARRKYSNQRMKIDLRYKLNHRIRCGIALSLKGNKNDRHWEILVGYNINILKDYLETTMPKGYVWQDYLEGKLHVDHIIPIRAFTFRTPRDEEFKACWSLYNLRLLPAEENHMKKDRIVDPILLGLAVKSGRQVRKVYVIKGGK
jgi:hypothetical protein